MSYTRYRIKQFSFLLYLFNFVKKNSIFLRKIPSKTGGRGRAIPLPQMAFLLVFDHFGPSDPFLWSISVKSGQLSFFYFLFLNSIEIDGPFFGCKMESWKVARTFQPSIKITHFKDGAGEQNYSLNFIN